MSRLALGAGAMVAACSGSPALGATLLVHPDGTGPYPNIQAALDAASGGDEVVLTDGVFRGEGNHDVSFLGKAVTVRSQSGDPEHCVIDCEGVVGSVDFRPGFHFVSGEGPDSILEAVTVTNGWHDIGGAVLCYISSPTVRECVLRGNAAWEAGALFAQWGSPTIEDCVIVDNVATRFPGGGLMFYNATYAGGGGTVRGCTIGNNEAGVHSSGVDQPGGGLSVHASSTVFMENCIISHSSRGEGIFCDATSSLSVTCTTIFGNAGGDWVSCIAPQLSQGGNLAQDPLFCDATGGDYSLAANSPCAAAASGCGLMGALDVRCGPTGLSRTSWGRLKASYR